MQMGEFYDQIEAHPDLEGVGIDQCQEKQPGLVVRHNRSGLLTRLPLAVIETADWKTLEDVLIGRREPQVLQHMTRVVGYFSRIENWNKSKIGELKDRHKGDYAVAG
ncbi:MAG: anaerobic ribonucleoside-triphosphate reductase [Planctomycetota bacterium]|jgi:hypothetical protein|nr:anaerobic ribonucleoside-triphosphate reductase [Planctomycetota bacterium]